MVSLAGIRIEISLIDWQDTSKCMCEKINHIASKMCAHKCEIRSKVKVKRMEISETIFCNIVQSTGQTVTYITQPGHNLVHHDLSDSI